MECDPRMSEFQVLSTRSLRWQRAERVIEILVGALFLVTGVFKSWGIVGWSLSSPNSRSLRSRGGCLLPRPWPLQFSGTLLGACLVLGTRPTIVLPATLLTLGVFSAVLVYIWMDPTLENCGCMDPISILGDRFAHPAFGLTRNVVLMALVAFAWHRRSTAPAK